MLAIWILLGGLNIMVLLQPLHRIPFVQTLGLYSKANMIALVVPGQVGDAVITFTDVEKELCSFTQFLIFIWHLA